MAGFKDEVGNTYDKLTVVRREENSRKGQARWLCDCECGNTVVTIGESLRSGNTGSCGCRSSYSDGIAAFNALYQSYVKRAERKDLPWRLTKVEFRLLTSSACYYCGVGPSQTRRAPGCNGDYEYNGIDRVDNTGGYALENCVSCCGRCNSAKGTQTIIEFRKWINVIHRRL